MSAAGRSLEEDSWKMALDFLREAEAASPAVMPRMATHAAYYAMFHAARAVLLQADGLAAPTKHTAVIGRFGRLAKQTGNAGLMAAGRLVNDTQRERLLSDYDSRRQPLPADAASSVRDARTFLVTCSTTFGFRAPRQD